MDQLKLFESVEEPAHYEPEEQPRLTEAIWERWQARWKPTPDGRQLKSIVSGMPGERTENWDENGQSVSYHFKRDGKIRRHINYSKEQLAEMTPHKLCGCGHDVFSQCEYHRDYGYQENFAEVESRRLKALWSTWWLFPYFNPHWIKGGWHIYLADRPKDEIHEAGFDQWVNGHGSLAMVREFVLGLGATDVPELTPYHRGTGSFIQWFAGAFFAGIPVRLDAWPNPRKLVAAA